MHPNDLAVRIMLFVPVLLSLSVHEWAHAFTAHRLGDDTAKLEGRLTLNPLAHMDFIGTFLLPLMGIPFGWAKPVPVNPVRFSRRLSMSTGMLLTAAAGPLSNLGLAASCYGLLVSIDHLAPALFLSQPAIHFFLSYGLTINISLALFNLLPIPPLDGSRIVDGVMPFAWRARWEKVSGLGMYVLIALFVLPGLIFHLSPVGWVVGNVLRWLGA